MENGANARFSIIFPDTFSILKVTKGAIKNWFDVRYSIFNIQILNVEYRISN